MLVSSFPSYTRGGPMPLAGAPRDLYAQLLACSSSQNVVAIACCLRAILCFGVFSSLPPSWGMGQVSIGQYVFHWIVQCDGAWWAPLAGLPWISPPHAKALACSTNFVGTNAQTHLLVMSLTDFCSFSVAKARLKLQHRLFDNFQLVRKIITTCTFVREKRGWNSGVQSKISF